MSPYEDDGDDYIELKGTEAVTGFKPRQRQQDDRGTSRRAAGLE